MFSRSAFGCHENSDPGIKKKDLNSSQSYYLKCFIVTQCSKAATARKDRDIYPFRFIAVASRGYKNWLQFEQHYSHSDFNFYFFGKKNLPANVLKRTQTWFQLRSMNALRATRPWRHNLCAPPSIVRQLTPLRHQKFRHLTLQQECYLQKHSSFFPPVLSDGLNATFELCPRHADESFIEIRHFEYCRALFVVVFLTYGGITLSEDAKKNDWNITKISRAQCYFSSIILAMLLFADLGGGCRGCTPPPPPPEMTYGFLTQLVFCKKVWFIGVSHAIP